jgi:CO/xanthine dehydrogenase Mo-binding subunit
LYLGSNRAHALLTRTETTEACSSPGVVDVVTATELDLPPLAFPAAFPPSRARLLLASGRVRFVGEATAAVVAETAATAANPLDLIEFDYDPLPVVVDPSDALADEVLRYPDIGSNVVVRDGGSEGADPSACEAFDRANCPSKVTWNASLTSSEQQRGTTTTGQMGLRSNCPCYCTSTLQRPAP